jgi:hypothetical protein
LTETLRGYVEKGRSTPGEPQKNHNDDIWWEGLPWDPEGVSVDAQAEDKAEDKAETVPGLLTKKQFFAAAKRTAERKDEEFDQARIAARFDMLDTNKYGKLTLAERVAGR